MVVSLGLVYASIFKMPLEQYFPFLAIGLVVWTLISTSITEGCQVFISSEPVIKQIRLPFSVHACRCLWRNAIILGHNMIIIVAIVVLFQPGASLGLLLLLIPSLVLIFLSGLWVTLLLGMICARFRDVPQVISSLLQIAFFLTPIIWHPSLLSGRQRVVYWNPLYHYVELIRMPLLGEAPSAHTWIMTVTITVLGWCFTFAFFRRFRGRIAYWV
jgi:lipopolysaccharide transport system permease protein